MGRLPAAADNIGRVGLANNHFYRAVGEQGSDKVVTFADYGPTRMEPPTRANDEILYAGSFANPPIGNFVLNALAWDRGSEVWIRNQVHNGASWVTTFGPPDYHQGNLFQTNADAAVHVPNASYVGRIYIIGHGVNQKPKVVTGYTAPVAPSAEWIPIGLTIQDVADQVSGHNVIADAHQDIRGLINGLTSQIASLMAGTGLYQGAWDTDTSYSQTQIVHHGDGASRRYYMYLDPTARSGEDPAQSEYWQELYDGVREHPGGGNNIRVKKGELIRTDRDVYLCITAPANPIGADALKVIARLYLAERADPLALAQSVAHRDGLQVRRHRYHRPVDQLHLLDLHQRSQQRQPDHWGTDHVEGAQRRRAGLQRIHDVQLRRPGHAERPALHLQELGRPEQRAQPGHAPELLGPRHPPDAHHQLGPDRDGADGSRHHRHSHRGRRGLPVHDRLPGVDPPQRCLHPGQRWAGRNLHPPESDCICC